MTARQADWSVVHHTHDPVPADEWDVRRVARQYQQRGDDLAASKSALQRLSELSGWTGEAAEEFAKKAADRVEDLGTAAEKYLDVAAALTTYAGHVATARSDTWDALQRATEAEEQRRRLDGDPLAGIEDPTPEQLAARVDQWDRRAEWAAARGKAAGDVEEALERLRDRASQCADEIRRASEKFSDGWWDDVKGWVRDHADTIKMIVDVMKWIAVAVAAIGLVVALFVSAPFVVVAGLVALGIALAVGILAGDALLLTVGEATWGDIAWDTAGVVLSVVGGRAALQAARSLPSALGNARNAVVASEQAAARSNLPQNVKNALNITSARGAGLRRWADREVAEAITGAASGVDEMLKVSPTLSARLRVLDSEIATTIEKLRVLRGFDVPAAAESIRVAQGLVKGVVVANWTGLTTALDEVADQVGGISLSAVPRGLVDEAVDEVGDLRWRLAAAG